MPGKKPNKVDLENFRQLLERLRRVISHDIWGLEADAFETDGERASIDNPADNGSDSFAQEFSLELLARDEETLGEIQAALERIGEGSFGRCETCGIWITKARLRAVPHARNCVGCQREKEKAG